MRRTEGQHKSGKIHRTKIKAGQKIRFEEFRVEIKYILYMDVSTNDRRLLRDKYSSCHPEHSHLFSREDDKDEW